MDAIAFEELKFNGELRILSDVELRSKLARYYSSVDSRRQFDDIRLHNTITYIAHLDSLLLPDQIYRMIDAEDPENIDIGRADFSDTEALSLLDRVRNNRDYVRELPFNTSQRNIMFSCVLLKKGATEILSILDRRLLNGT